MANRESARTPKLYDRRDDELRRSEKPAQFLRGFRCKIGLGLNMAQLAEP